MNYDTMCAALRGRYTAESELHSIYEDIVKAEKAHLQTMDAANQEVFKEAYRDLIDDRWGDDRRWGVELFTSTTYLEEVEIDANGIKLRYAKEDYCRGCHMGTDRETILIPTYLIDAHDNERAYRAALDKFMAARIAPIAERVAKDEAEEVRKAQEAAVAKERRDREEWERLQQKFGGQS